MSFPEAEIKIDTQMVRSLVNSQFPEFSKHPVSFLSEGYDNTLYRLGDAYLIRVPRRGLGAELINHEIEWLPKLCRELPIKLPSPIKVGANTKNYPWRWTIIPYFDGNSVLNRSLDESEINRLVRFLKKLHQVNSRGAPSNPYRNIPLSEKAASVDEKINQLATRGIEISNEIRELWERVIQEPIDSESRLIHGDLHPDNIIVNNGKIEAIIDWGDITKGDPATDLASLWMVADDPAVRKNALEIYEASDSTILRSRGWAIFYGITFLSIPKYQTLGQKILSVISP